MSNLKILLIPGSTRSGSVNVKLAGAMQKALQDAGADATLISLSDYDMPLYNGDLEEKSGAPENAKKLAAFIEEHQAVILVSPEYNASISPLLKNTIDWLSRDVGAKPYHNRLYALASCSPGALGGIRGLSHLRDALISIGAQEVITPQLAVGPAGSSFNDDGTLSNERHRDMLGGMVERIINRAADYK